MSGTGSLADELATLLRGPVAACRVVVGEKNMGWATAYIEQLRSGKTVQARHSTPLMHTLQREEQRVLDELEPA